jgi:radical SAM protein with 4Fe4S-binding SPASM domain
LYYAIAGNDSTFALSGPEIIQAAALVHELAESSDVRYVWQPPVHKRGSLARILEDGPRTAGDISIHVDENGRVYPARGAMVPAGNLLQDPWERIWGNEVFRKYRQRVESSTRCDVCPGLAVCAADCPADPQGWAAGEEP